MCTHTPSPFFSFTRVKRRGKKRCVGLQKKDARIFVKLYLCVVHVYFEIVNTHRLDKKKETRGPRKHESTKYSFILNGVYTRPTYCH